MAFMCFLPVPFCFSSYGPNPHWFRNKSVCVCVAKSNSFELYRYVFKSILRLIEVCVRVRFSIEFDRDCDYFAIAGVTKKIKVFEYGTVIQDAVDIHYPVNEMTCNSKIR